MWCVRLCTWFVIYMALRPGVCGCRLRTCADVCGLVDTQPHSFTEIKYETKVYFFLVRLHCIWRVPSHEKTSRTTSNHAICLLLPTRVQTLSIYIGWALMWNVCHFVTRVAVGVAVVEQEQQELRISQLQIVCHSHSHCSICLWHCVDYFWQKHFGTCKIGISYPSFPVKYQITEQKYKNCRRYHIWMYGIWLFCSN